MGNLILAAAIYNKTWYVTCFFITTKFPHFLLSKKHRKNPHIFSATLTTVLRGTPLQNLRMDLLWHKLLKQSVENLGWKRKSRFWVISI